MFSQILYQNEAKCFFFYLKTLGRLFFTSFVQISSHAVNNQIN